MIRTKLFTVYGTSLKIKQIDEKINSFITNLEAEIIDIKFSTTCVNKVMTNSALVIYKINI